MKKKNNKVFLLVLFILILSVSAHPADGKRDIIPKASQGNSADGIFIKGNFWALIIGIDDYDRWDDLQTAVKDAEKVKDVLISRYGFSKDRIKYLINGNATRRNIINSMEDFAKKVGKDDSLFIYYAGHGVLDNIAGYWIPSDSRDKADYIPNSQLRDYIKAIDSRHTFLVADSCFAGSLFTRSASPPPANPDNVYYSRVSRLKSRQGMTAGGLEPVTGAGYGGHSIFAYYFIKALEENGESYLLASSVFDSIKIKVANNARQTPFFKPLQDAMDEGGEFIFVVSAVKAAAPDKESISLAEERKRLETERRKLEDARAQLDDAKNIADEQKRIAEERARLEAERKRIEEENIQLAMEQKRRDEERKKKEKQQKEPGMVYIPAGEFLMGSPPDEIQWIMNTYSDAKRKDCESEQPQHRVYVDPFYISRYEVTNREFRLFADDTGYRTDAERGGEGFVWNVDETQWEQVSGADWRHPQGPESTIDGMMEHPVVQVSWNDANEYCKWLTRKIGKSYRLPTEAEWEKASRGGLSGQKFPWGDNLPTGIECNFADRNTYFAWSNKSVDDGYRYTSPVGSFKANGYGLYDMAGNVWEWCSDRYDGNYYRNSPKDNPKGPAASGRVYRVLRGGSWGEDPYFIRCSSRYRDNPDSWYYSFGFRVAQ